MDEEQFTPTESSLDNDRISKVLEAYKNAPPEELVQRRDELNDILLSAIDKYPGEVNGVEVTINSGSASRTWSDRFAGHFVEGRQRMDLPKYADLNGGQLTNIILPLPYSFTTGTHGSGERAAGAASEITIASGELIEIGSQNRRGGIGVQVEAQFMTPRLVMFDAKEIKEIKFVKVDKYSPYLDQRDEPRLVDRPSPTQHYLNYRGFRNPWNPTDAGNFGVDPETFAKLSRETVVNDNHSFLKISANRRKLEKGFVATVEDGKSVLYEFTDVKLKNTKDMYGSDALGRVWFDYKTGKKSGRFKDSVIRHEGDEVVKRLSSIESTRKF